LDYRRKQLKTTPKKI